MEFNYRFNFICNKLGSILLFLTCSLSIAAQKDTVAFASKFFIKSQFGLSTYGDSEDLVDIGIKYFDNEMMISINNYLSVGLHYDHIIANDKFRNKKDNFYRMGILAQWNISPDRSRIKYYLHSNLDYGNFTIGLDDRLTKRNVYYFGLKFNIEVKIIDHLYAILGFKGIRQLEKGGYGIENYPFIGLSYEFVK